MDNIYLSVIVPVYNVANYLPECIDSILAQNIPNMEILLINDGSTDNSVEIVQDYADRYENIICFHTKNQGLSAARNYCIDRARGTYIAFVDGDDFLPTGAYQDMLQVMEDGQCDITAGMISMLRKGKPEPQKRTAGIFHGKIEYVTLDERPELVQSITVTNKIYRCSFLKSGKLRFPEGIVYEDGPFTIPCLHRANIIGLLPRICYIQRIRENSPPSITQQRTNIDNAKDRVKSMQLVANYVATNISSSNVLREIHNFWLLQLATPFTDGTKVPLYRLRQLYTLFGPIALELLPNGTEITSTSKKLILSLYALRKKCFPMLWSLNRLAWIKKQLH